MAVMFRIILFSIFLISSSVFSQSLGNERIEKLSQSVVRIYIENEPSGTGFVVSEDGWIVTSRHVVEPAIIRDSIGTILGFKTVYAKFQNDKKASMGLMTYQLKDIGHDESTAYDYILIRSDPYVKMDYIPLRLGKWEDINEGDAIYSCGYPLNIGHRFISAGMFSTKWKEAVFLGVPNDTVYKEYKRDSGWMDLTLNRGNSGGPIIKLGRTPDEDFVVGIATFILSPYGKIGEEGSEFYSKLYKKNNETGMSINKQMAVLFQSISNSSFGVSGAVSIDYLSATLAQLSQK